MQFSSMKRCTPTSQQRLWSRCVTCTAHPKVRPSASYTSSRYMSVRGTWRLWPSAVSTNMYSCSPRLLSLGGGLVLSHSEGCVAK